MCTTVKFYSCIPPLKRMRKFWIRFCQSWKHKVSVWFFARIGTKNKSGQTDPCTNNGNGVLKLSKRTNQLPHGFVCTIPKWKSTCVHPVAGCLNRFFFFFLVIDEYTKMCKEAQSAHLVQTSASIGALYGFDLFPMLFYRCRTPISIQSAERCDSLLSHTRKVRGFDV